MTTTDDRPLPADAPGLQECRTSLLQEHDVVLLDLDGVVYVGPDAVPGAVPALERVRAGGARLAFVTNNASRPPKVVAEHLSGLGVTCDAEDVVTSAQAAAHHLRTVHGAGSRILRIGGAGLTEALLAEGLQPVDALSEDPVAVVQGFSPDLTWRHLAEATQAVRAGLPWTATNLDLTVPIVGGPAPGNGTLVHAVRVATGVEPFVVGKPEPALFAEAVRRSGAQRPIVVGDRLDTDLEGARRAGVPGLLVMTGVTGAAELLRARPEERPTHVAMDLNGLLQAHPATESADDGDRMGVRCGAAHLVLDGRRVETRHGPAVTPTDVLRAAAVLAWRAMDSAVELDAQVLVAVAEDALAQASGSQCDVAGRR